jgi:hypothetical protein
MSGWEIESSFQQGRAALGVDLICSDEISFAGEFASRDTNSDHRSHNSLFLYQDTKMHIPQCHRISELIEKEFE